MVINLAGGVKNSTITRWWFHMFFYFHPYLDWKWSNLMSMFFADGLVQPPTRFLFTCCSNFANADIQRSKLCGLFHWPEQLILMISKGRIKPKLGKYHITLRQTNLAMENLHFQWGIHLQKAHWGSLSIAMLVYHRVLDYIHNSIWGW